MSMYSVALVLSNKYQCHHALLLSFKAAAQIYFNCSSLIGVELENQGTSGTAGSHWEKRILGVGLVHKCLIIPSIPIRMSS